MDINGKWTGTLIYGDGYSENIIGKELTFEFTISESDSNIVGYGRDIAGYGVNPSESNIKGFIDGNIISFIKQYKSAGYFDLNDESFLIENEPSLEITYNGVFDIETNEYNGDWDILMDHKQNGNDWLDYECTGTWKMHKVS